MRILGKGIYTYGEAGRLIQAPPARLRAWFHGRPTGRGPLLKSDHSRYAAQTRTISFLDVIEALVALELRASGVSLIALRKAYSRLAGILGTGHPFSHKGLFTDGETVFVKIADESDDEVLIDAIRRQRVFPTVLLPYLDRIAYSEDTRLAEHWRIMDGIIIDPARRFGKPIVDASGMPTSILAASYTANGDDAELVADWYGVAGADVKLAVDFEAQLARAAA